MLAASAPVAELHLPADLTKEELTTIHDLGLSFDRCGGARTLYVSKEQRDALRAAGIPFSIEHEDLQAYYASRNQASLSFGGFRTLAEIEAYLDSLTLAHPTLITAKFSIGTTIQGRSIWAVKISDNPNLDENEPELFYNSLIHAREPASAASLLYFMEYLLSNYGIDQAATDVVNERELYLVPAVNPDGYYYNEQLDEFGGGLWRKNRRLISGSTYGVDLNRNFAYGWGEDNVGSSGTTSSETYRGTAPFSEPETEAIRDFVSSRSFVLANNVHCYSNLYLWPWGGSARITTSQEPLFSAIGDSLASGNGYLPGVGWELYPVNGAADDWMWGDTSTGRSRIISFTTEIGALSDGFWPNPSRIPALVQENLAPNLFLASIADNPYKFAAPKQPLLLLEDTVETHFQIDWSHSDSINPAVSFDVSELLGRETVTDDVETVQSYWVTNRFARTTTRSHSGFSSWGTLDANGEGHWLQSTLPHTVAAGDSLVFWVWYSLESDYDYFYAQVATDGGYEFVSLAGNLTSMADPLNYNLGNGMTSSSGGWQRAVFSLDGYEGEEVIFRLIMISDGGTLSEGVYIDDIELVERATTETLVATGLTDTTLLLSGKPAGDYWYRVRATDAENQSGRYSRIVKTTVLPAFQIGDIDASGQIDIADLTFFVDYLFLKGVAPNPIERANCDCTGQVDIADLIRLVDALFVSQIPISCP